MGVLACDEGLVGSSGDAGDTGNSGDAGDAGLAGLAGSLGDGAPGWRFMKVKADLGSGFTFSTGSVTSSYTIDGRLLRDGRLGGSVGLAGFFGSEGGS